MAQAMLDEINFQIEPNYDNTNNSQFVLDTPAPPMDQSGNYVHQEVSFSENLPLKPDQMEIPPKRKSSLPKSFSSNVKRNSQGRLYKENSQIIPNPSSVTPQPPSKVLNLQKDLNEVSPTKAAYSMVKEEEPKKYGRCDLKFVRVLNDALPPFRATPKSAGFDLCSPIDYIVEPGAIVKINIGLKFQLPRNTYGCITSRSSLASKGLVCLQGTVDEDYRGNIFVLLQNCNHTKSLKICRGDAIAQIICIKISYPKAIQVRELNSTLRGANGFGSTDIKRKKLE